ncbi:hypothetical protein [Celeribacter litoreus]|uniref:hypothetical protein n=1 Tax=Celeribacter litoreus TaxID=2876714 RepID=UPI001CCD8B51|nr:hypothetical protein [Celeribacter litoreus]MCA0042843.1 hypothetical protein [Celeribacter litoreus]
MEKYELLFTIFLPAALFFCGFNYVQSYYAFFEVSTAELGLEFQSILAHSVKALVLLMTPMVTVIWCVLAILTSLAACAVKKFLCKNVEKTALELTLRYAPPSFALFVIAHLLAVSGDLGRDEARNDVKDLPALFLQNISQKEGAAKHYAFMTEQKNLRFLATSATHTIAVQVYPADGTSALEIVTIRIPHDTGLITNVRDYK